MKTGVFFLPLVLVITTLTVGMNNADKTSPPEFQKQYSISGILKMPYPGIREPFDCYYDKKNEISRIDYYGGMTKTYRKYYDDSYGTSYKVAHITNEIDTNQLECFSFAGTSDNIIYPQSVIPGLSSYYLVAKNVTCGDTLCNKWEYTRKYLKLVKTSTFLVTLDGAPFQYTVDGYSDKYEYDYFNYTPGEQDSSLFDIDPALKCHSMLDSLAEDYHDHNPWKELIDHNDTHVDDMFEEFKAKHGKQYENDLEHETRKLMFKQNVRFIHSTNRAGHTFKLAMNQFGDLTAEELKGKRGRLYTDKEHQGGILFTKERHLHGDAALPDTVDWRTKGAVTPVKDQAMCGSCWSFGTTGTIEGALFRTTGKLVSLSEQALVDCSWGFRNFGCDGGLDYRAYQWIQNHGGIPTNESYGQYLAEDGFCELNNTTKVAAIQDYVRVPKSDGQSLKYAIATYGPVSVSIDSTVAFLFYSSGLFVDPVCGDSLSDLDHTVLAVGYGVLNFNNTVEPYWLIKNSWSPYWGEEGYIRISQTTDCGVTTAASFVFLEGEVEPVTPLPITTSTTSRYSTSTTARSSTRYSTSTTASSPTSRGGAATVGYFFHLWSIVFPILLLVSLFN